MFSNADTAKDLSCKPKYSLYYSMWYRDLGTLSSISTGHLPLQNSWQCNRQKIDFFDFFDLAHLPHWKSIDLAKSPLMTRSCWPTVSFGQWRFMRLRRRIIVTTFRDLLSWFMLIDQAQRGLRGLLFGLQPVSSRGLSHRVAWGGNCAAQGSATVKPSYEGTVETTIQTLITRLPLMITLITRYYVCFH